MIDHDDDYQSNDQSDEIFREQEKTHNYYVFEDVDYYEFYNELDETSKFFITSKNLSIFRCRHCKKSFSFNNKLHLHVRKTHQQKFRDKIVTLLVEIKQRKFFANVFTQLKNSFAISKDLIILVIVFTMNSRKNVDIKYDFLDWSYARARVELSLNFELEHVYFDIDFSIVLMNRQFFKTQFDAFIRKMTISISIRDLRTTKHVSNEYVIVSLFFSSKNKENNVVMTKITREIYLVDDFKINILIDNDLLDSKRITIDVTKKFAYIESCDVIVDIEIKTIRIVVHERVHARKVVDVSSRSKMIILVHHTTISTNRDFLFESNDTKSISLCSYYQCENN